MMTMVLDCDEMMMRVNTNLLVVIRAVVKRLGQGGSLGHCECGPQLLS